MADQTPPGTGPQVGADASTGARGRPFVVGVVVAGLVVLGLSAWQLATQPLSASLIVLLALTAGAGWLTLRVPSMPISFSISDTFSTAAALLVGPAAGALTAALDGVMLSFRMQSSARTATRLLFNSTAPPLAIWLAAQAFFALAGSNVLSDGPFRVPRLFALVAVFGVLNFGLTTGLVATAVGLERRTPISGIWREHFVGLWVTYLGGIFASMLMLVLSGERGAPMTPLEVLLLIAPLPVILYVTFTTALGRAQDQIEHLGGMNQVYVATIEALAQTIDAKDQVTHDHIRRVQENSVRLANAIGVTDDLEIQALKAASLLHDVGKISVPEHILNKPGRLNPSELEIMKRHAPVGADILSVIGFPYPVVPIVRHHHENWDGTGYPDGLVGEAIPIGARILSVVDCFDALTSDRPYRPRFDPEAALRVLLDRRGTMYDPHVVDAFMALHAEGKNEIAPPSLMAPVADPHAQPAVAESPPDPNGGGFGELEAFSRLGADLAATRTIDEVGRAVWRHLQANLQAATIVLLTYDEASDALVPAFHAGAPAMEPSTRVPVGERLSGWVAATRQPIVNSDARLDVDPDLRDDSRLQSALSVPIETGDRFLGVLAFYSDRSQAFTPSHQRLAEAAASIVAVLVAESGLGPVLVPATVSRAGTTVSRP